MLLEKSSPKVPHNNPDSLPGRISAEKVDSTFYCLAVLVKGGNGEIMIKVIVEQFFAACCSMGGNFLDELWTENRLFIPHPFEVPHWLVLWQYSAAVQECMQTYACWFRRLIQQNTYGQYHCTVSCGPLPTYGVESYEGIPSFITNHFFVRTLYLLSQANIFQ